MSVRDVIDKQRKIFAKNLYRPDRATTGFNGEITLKELSGELEGYIIFDVSRMDMSDVVGTAAITREFGGLGMKALLESPT